MRLSLSGWSGRDSHCRRVGRCELAYAMRPSVCRPWPSPFAGWCVDGLYIVAYYTNSGGKCQGNSGRMGYRVCEGLPASSLGLHGAMCPCRAPPVGARIRPPDAQSLPQKRAGTGASPLRHTVAQTPARMSSRTRGIRGVQRHADEDTLREWGRSRVIVDLQAKKAGAGRWTSSVCRRVVRRRGRRGRRNHLVVDIRHAVVVRASIVQADLACGAIIQPTT